MTHKKTLQVPATTKEVVERTTCDFCGAAITESRRMGQVAK